MSLLCYSPQLDVVVVTTRWRTYRAYCTSVAFPHRQTLSCVRVSYRPGEGCVRVQRAPGWGRDAWARSALPHPEEPETHPTPSTHDPASASPAPSPPADTPPHESTSHHASSFWGEPQPQNNGWILSYDALPLYKYITVIRNESQVSSDRFKNNTKCKSLMQLGQHETRKMFGTVLCQHLMFKLQVKQCLNSLLIWKVTHLLLLFQLFSCYLLLILYLMHFHCAEVVLNPTKDILKYIWLC